MNPAIQVPAQEQKVILALLKAHLSNTTVWIYGSRVTGTALPQSDLDMAIFSSPDQRLQVSDLKEAFDESNLPFRVDLFVWDEIPKQFKANIEVEHFELVGKEG